MPIIHFTFSMPAYSEVTLVNAIKYRQFITTSSWKWTKNGGIANDGYITRPDTMAEGKKEYSSTTIPVKMEQTSNRNKDFYVYLTQRYRLGFKRRVLKEEAQNNSVQQRFSPAAPTTSIASSIAPADSLATDSLATDSLPANNLAMGDNLSLDSLNSNHALPEDTNFVEEFVPVTSFIHTFKIERARHKYQSVSTPDENAYYNKQGVSRDSTTAFSVKNVFGIALLEGFNRYAKAGLTGYISHKFSRYDLMNADSMTVDVSPNKKSMWVVNWLNDKVKLYTIL